MNKNLFIKHIRWLFREYDAQFRLALKAAKEEPVHDLRVMIKRLTTLFLFLDEADIYKKRSSDFFKRLRTFFRSAGYLRDMQVLRSLIGNYKIRIKYDISEYEYYLEGKETSAKNSFFNSSEKYPKLMQAEVTNAIIGSVRKFNDESLTQKSFAFMIMRLNRIDEYLQSTSTSKYLHKIRQTLKELRYFIEIFQAGADLYLIGESDYIEIKEIENIIGGWNDRSILIEDIKNYKTFNQKFGYKSTWPDLNTLERVIETDRKKMVKDIKIHLPLEIFNNVIAGLFTIHLF
jgi:CHAD domain-containing protein